ncbi:MAG: hypothetical protein JXR37_35285 [Kiritimatiellae bacterium]|nr:hypothetical protein [Kiritimatiellia bacterium]
MPEAHAVKVLAEPRDTCQFRVSVVKRKQPYVCVRIEGSMTKAGTIRFLSAAARHARQIDTHRFLLDLRDAQNVTSTLDDYEIAYRELENLGIWRGSKLALFTRSKSATDSFFQVVAYNAGYLCEIFSEEAAAVKWLQD